MGHQDKTERYFNSERIGIPIPTPPSGALPTDIFACILRREWKIVQYCICSLCCEEVMGHWQTENEHPKRLETLQALQVVAGCAVKTECKSMPLKPGSTKWRSGEQPSNCSPTEALWASSHYPSPSPWWSPPPGGWPMISRINDWLRKDPNGQNTTRVFRAWVWVEILCLDVIGPARLLDWGDDSKPHFQEENHTHETLLAPGGRLMYIGFVLCSFSNARVLSGKREGSLRQTCAM